MSITDTPPPAQPERKKRKYVRKARVPMYPREVREAMKPKPDPVEVYNKEIARVNRGGTTPEEEAEFAGLTGGPNGACCDRCFAARCVITGTSYCGHPHKGGLHAGSMGQSVVVNRYARAKEYLRTGR